MIRIQEVPTGIKKRRMTFWSELLEKANRKTHLHANCGPRVNYFLDRTVALGTKLVYVVMARDSRVEVYIDSGDATVNAGIYAYLFSCRQAIESRFGGPLEWEDLKRKRAFRISKWLDTRGLDDEESWPQTQDALIDAMLRLERAFDPCVKELRRMSGG